MADIGLSAFAVFFIRSPSFLGHQRALEEGHGRSNCQTLFSMVAIPTDADIRLMLDGAPTAAFDPLFFKTIQTAGALEPFRPLGGRVLIAQDPLSALHDPAPVGRRHGIFPRLPGCQDRRTGSPTGLAAASRIHRPPGRRGEAGLRTQRRETLAHAARLRARWKIESETFNVLKTNGYNLEHNFGYGKETLASVLVILNLLAFGCHAAARLGHARMAQGGHRAGCDIPLLRAPAYRHCLCRIGELGPPAALHRSRRSAATLIETPFTPPLNPHQTGTRLTKNCNKSIWNR